MNGNGSVDFASLGAHDQATILGLRLETLAFDESKHPRDPAGGRWRELSEADRIELLRLRSLAFNPDRLRDYHGRWAIGGTGLTNIETQQLYKQEDGTYIPERQALHNAIIAAAFEGKTPVENPKVQLMGGGPGVGKTTALKSLDTSNHVFVTPDDIKAQLPEWAQRLGGVDAAALLHEESSDVSKMIMRRAAEGSYNIVIDGTGDNSLKSLVQKLGALRGSGYAINAQYVTTSIETALARAESRALNEARVPAGSPAGGRWTVGGGGARRLSNQNEADEWGGADGDVDFVRVDLSSTEDVLVARHLALRFGIEQLLQRPVAPISATTGYSRQPTKFEGRVCMLSAISTTYATGGDQLASALRRANARMREDLLKRVADGRIKREDPSGLRRTRPKGEAEMVALIRDRFLDVALVGRTHSREELDRQRALAKDVAQGKVKVGALSALAAGDDLPPYSFDPILPGSASMLPAGSLLPLGASQAAEITTLIEQSGGSWGVRAALTEILAVEARVTSQIDVDEIWARLAGETVRVYNESVRNGLSEADTLKAVEVALQDLSPAKLDGVARQTARVAYNQGRDAGNKEAAVAGQAQWVVRSELLDTPSICKNCKELDGVYLKIGTKQYEQNVPPTHCLGGDNCRGWTVVVSAELAKALDRMDAS